MIGDKLLIEPHHLPPAREVFALMKSVLENQTGIYVFNISGESGSGKSTLAIALKSVLEEHGFHSYIFHMDDYFKLPPASNHNQRLSSLDFVGPGEVDLELLDSHINKIKNGAKKLIKPLVYYKENEISTEHVGLDGINVVIVEGTYTTLLQNIDCRIFLDRDYKITLKDRIARAREPITEFIESVLEIEHQIISSHKSMADLVLGQEYQILQSTL